MKGRRKYAIRAMWAVLVVVGAEGLSAWWMSPPEVPGEPVLEWRTPVGGAWNSRRDLYEEVDEPLLCSSGWIGDQEGDVPMRISFFRWDSTDTVNTLEAFKHLPEQCMGAIGMKLEKVFPQRRIEMEEGTLVFDSTRFRGQDGGRAVYLFKCVWVSGIEESNLRSGVLDGTTGNELRRLRLAAAMSRFQPRHTRVVMGGVSGLPTEELAWRTFRSAVEEHLEWTRAEEGG